MHSENNQDPLDTAHISEQVRELDLLIERATPAQLAQSLSDELRLFEILRDEDTVASHHEEICNLDLELANAVSQVDRFRATLAMDLMICECDWLVSSDPSLLSPAGFHPDEMVYEQSLIAIHTDDPDFVIPTCNVALYLHDMRGERSRSIGGES